MIFNFRLSVFCVVAVFAAQSVWAESVYTCPDIAQAKQVGDCPSDEEMKRMFMSSCGLSDTKGENPHAKGLCKNFVMFSKAKNTALWESGDGEYMGYITCDQPAAKIKAGKLIKVSLGQKGVMDRIICGYEGGAELVLRTRQTCEIPGAIIIGRYMGRYCSEGDKDCKAVCE